jgi:hypothetical protein
VSRAGLKISKALVQTCPWALLHVDKDESHHANISMALLHDDRDVADNLSSSFMGQLRALFSEMCTKFGPLLGWALGLRTHRTPSEPALIVSSPGSVSGTRVHRNDHCPKKIEIIIRVRRKEVL